MRNRNSGDSANPIDVVVEIDSIYRTSPVTVRLSAPRPFTVQVLEATVAAASGGSRWTPDTVDADGQTCIEIVGGITELAVAGDTRATSPHRYGMRWYPFLSSVHRLSLSVTSGVVRDVRVKLKHPYRYLPGRVERDGRTVQFDENAAREPSGDVVEVYDWSTTGFLLLPRDGPLTTLALTVPMRMGGAALARLTRLPLGYWVLSLAVITVVGLVQPPATAAVVAGLWFFTLKNWMESERPQRLTLLGAGYLAAGAIAAAWALVLVVAGAWALLAVVVPLSLVGVSVWAERRFDAIGRLPMPLAVMWRRVVIWLDG